MGLGSTNASAEHPTPLRPNAVRRRWPPLLAYLALGLVLYAPSLPGGPISDDYGFLLNPWVIDPSPRHLLEILDPTSQATISLRNYAPVRALVNALEWRLAAENAPVYHATNVATHALACWLVALLLIQSGLPEVTAFLGGAFLLVHPAQVEAVAWMSQIWNALAMALGAGALLAQRNRPRLAFALFALALLTRPTSVCFLPAAWIRAFCWRRARAGAPPRFAGLAAWTLALAVVGAAELATFHDAGAAARFEPAPDALAKARTLVAGFGRYVAMAVTGFGVSPFQEPRVALSWLDPWWLLGLAAGAASGARTLVCLARGREEAAWWAWALAAFAPISQLFPFLYPTADRYLYFMLPGLLGGALLAGQDATRRIASPDARRLAALVAVACAAAAIGAFGIATYARSAIWLSEDRVLADAARHFPHGVAANLLAARRAASQGDVDAAVAAIEACRARGWDYYTYLMSHPAFEPVRGLPAFQASIARFADGVIETETRRARKTQLDWRDLAQAYQIRGRDAEAAAALEQGIALGGPLDASLRAELARLRSSTPGAAAIMPPGAPPEER